MDEGGDAKLLSVRHPLLFPVALLSRAGILQMLVGVLCSAISFVRKLVRFEQPVRFDMNCRIMYFMSTT
ncbi:hypothetical protein F511_43945 [Dorcoceras hygrometricum]|uniref:Uncharacterized protein n=1 Tax=Dorcoceras hygrometricum TaxID=472368 RepID=A0A2Z7A5V7_9LAMI|nr:hypothetical protein F511_43945 [Dorcoceras hygrometricum]